MRYFLDFGRDHVKGTFKKLEKEAGAWARTRAEQKDVTSTNHTYHIEEEDEQQHEATLRNLRVSNWENLNESEDERGGAGKEEQGQLPRSSRGYEAPIESTKGSSV